MDQVDAFVNEVKGHGNVDMISIMGGEPTLHPAFRLICEKLAFHLLFEKQIRRLQVVTNGTNQITPMLGLGICTSRPEEKAHLHRCQFVAPFDTGQELKDCPVPDDCGVSWGAFGWWPCGAGGAICRLFNYSEYRRDTIPDTVDDFPNRNKMCILCQAKAKTYMLCRDFGDIRSVSFRKAISEFSSERLERY